MNNFVLGMTSQIYFGKDCTDQLFNEAQKHGKKALLVYGQNSVVKYGILDKVTQGLQGLDYVTFSGVKPNPTLAHAQKGVGFAKESQVDLVIAIGGGSVIDEAKAIAAGVKLKSGDIWRVQTGEDAIESALPVIAICTVPATSSETNAFFVLTNQETDYKVGIFSEHIRPKAAFLDPQFTLSLGKTYTAYAAVDMISHLTEAYFTAQNSFAPVTFHYIEGLCQAIFECVAKVMADPNDYLARAWFMWAASLAFNGLHSAGLDSCVYFAHKLEHPLSGIYNVAHGAGLAVVTPAVLAYKKAELKEHLALFGKNVFKLTGPDNRVADQAIDSFKKWYRELGVPTNFKELGIENPDIDKISDQAYQLAKTLFQKTDLVKMYEMCC